jgi:signal transduction histidine kinase
LEIINRNGQHLQILLNGILDITKIEAGCVPVQCQDFELEDLLLGLQKRFQLQANTKGISLIVESDPTIPLTLHTDEIKLRQILANLLGNALKFTERGQICLQVARVNPAKAQIVIEPPGLVENVSTATEGPAQQVEKLRFEVVDTGLGIAPEAFDRLFEPFAQTSSGESLHQGSGLGLAISDQLVQLLGGKIEVESQVGVGSRFWFDLPIASTPSRLSNQPD